MLTGRRSVGVRAGAEHGSRISSAAPFRLAILEAHNEGCAPEPVATLTPLSRSLVDPEL